MEHSSSAAVATACNPFGWVEDGHQETLATLRTPLDEVALDEARLLGAGKRLFEGFSHSLELEHLGVRQSRYATFIDYRMKRA